MHMDDFVAEFKPPLHRHAPVVSSDAGDRSPADDRFRLETNLLGRRAFEAYDQSGADISGGCTDDAAVLSPAIKPGIPLSEARELRRKGD